MASSGSYTQKSVVQLQLLKAKWLVMLYCASDHRPSDADIEATCVEMVAASKANDNPAVGVLVLFYQSLSAGRRAQPANTIALYKIANGTIKQVGGIWPRDGRSSIQPRCTSS